jgi:hypothetical protein
MTTLAHSSVQRASSVASPLGVAFNAFSRVAAAATSMANTALGAGNLARLQRDNFPAYVALVRPTLAPKDQQNPFAYSLGANVPIEVKRQVFAEYQSGANAPKVELVRMAGANATFNEKAGPNGTVQINADLISTRADASKKGQFEAFAVWGYLEEMGHWGDMRAHQIMGRPGGDALGDEGARFAAMALPSVIEKANPGSFLASHAIKLSDGTTRLVQVDTVVLKALATEKLASGSFAKENRVDGLEHFGPEGHYQTTYVTAAGVGAGLKLPDADVDTIANRLALGSQLPDMLAKYDAFSQAKAKGADYLFDALWPAKAVILGSSWTAAEQRHLENVYEGLHALPRGANATVAWRNDERAETKQYISDQIAAGDFLKAGVAIHRYGDLHAHIQADGVPYSGDFGHGGDGHEPDYLYTTDAKTGATVIWDKVVQYQSGLSEAIATGLIAREANNGRAMPADALAKGVAGGKQHWTSLYVGALDSGKQQKGIFNRSDPATPAETTETYFQARAATFIKAYHDAARGAHVPLTIPQTEVGGGYQSSKTDADALNGVINRFKAAPQ